MMSDSEAPAIDPLVGQVIQERFRIEKKLGQGGMGAIYLAEHLLLQKRVAIKCLHAGLASNPDVVRRFKNEAVAASSIGHPNIVEVMDMGRFDDGTFYMVLEYLEGGDFQEALDAGGAQPVEDVAHIGVQICAALGAAAKKGIVHRDLKPENIFLTTRHGDAHFVKVLDFGISKILDGTGGATKTGELMGTPYYMAPEQVLGERDITHLADIYALGVIFFQALSGDVPFDGNTLAQIILKIASEPAPSLRERSSKVPQALSDLVAKMLSKDPSERPQNFREVALGLGPFLPHDSPFAQPGALEKVDSTPLSVPSSTAAHAATQLGTTRAPQLGSAAVTAVSPSVAHASVNWKEPRIIGAAALGLGVLLALFLFAGSSDETTKEAETAEDGAPETVNLEIATEPPSAQVFLDDKRLPNPYSAAVEKDGAQHRLVVKLEGYQDEKRTLSFAESQKLEIALSKVAASPKPTSTAARSGGSGAKPGSSGKPAPSPSPSSSSSERSRTPPKAIRDIERGLKKLF